jgi:hypothetical protein
LPFAGSQRSSVVTPDRLLHDVPLVDVRLLDAAMLPEMSATSRRNVG